jgi:quercetin dioxygenase-like cupin family protein
LDLEEFSRRYVVRYADLEPAKGAPPDATLARFARERLMVLGRASERPAGAAGPDIDAGINLAYVRCEPGKGFCAHMHPGWEIFVPMSGRWRITVQDGEDIEIDAWDAVSVPGDVFHGAVNISDGTAVMMSINPGADTARFAIAPEILAEIAEAARAAAGG